MSKSTFCLWLLEKSRTHSLFSSVLHPLYFIIPKWRALIAMSYKIADFIIIVYLHIGWLISSVLVRHDLSQANEFLCGCFHVLEKKTSHLNQMQKAPIKASDIDILLLIPSPHHPDLFQVCVNYSRVFSLSLGCANSIRLSKVICLSIVTVLIVSTSTFKPNENGHIPWTTNMFLSSEELDRCFMIEVIFGMHKYSVQVFRIGFCENGCQFQASPL